MAFDFPSSPTVGQEYTAHGVTYSWNGYAWIMSSSGSVPYVLKAGDTMTGALNITPTPVSFSKGIDITQSVGGSAATYKALNSILITGDNADVTGSTGTVVGLDMNYLVGPGDQGARQVFSATFHRHGASDSANTLYQDAAAGFSVHCHGNNNGTLGAEKGAAYAWYTSSQLLENATYWHVNCGAQIGIGVEAGSSCSYLIGFRIGTNPLHAVVGYDYDTAMDFCNESASIVGFESLITASNVGGKYPLNATGTFMRTLGAQTFTHGIDFSSATITGNLLAGPGYKVSGAAVATHTINLAANTSGNGLVLENVAAATAGNQRHSPRIKLSGAGWKTDATATSETMDWYIECRPIQGAAHPSNRLVITNQVQLLGAGDRIIFIDDNTTMQQVLVGAGAAQLMLYGGASQLAQFFANPAFVAIGALPDIPLIFQHNSANKVQLNGSVFSPYTDDLVALGSPSLKWSDLFVADGGVINFNNGNYTLTHSSGALVSSGSLVAASGALATTATTGFLYIPTCAGPPTGVPTTRSGTVPLVYDTSNNKLYAYNGAWRGGVVPGAWS